MIRYGPPAVTKFTYTLQQWASDAKNAAAWKEIMAANPGVTHDPFTDVDGNFIFGDGAFSCMPLSPNKAHRMGWTGFVDARESVFEMYREMAQLGMLPPLTTDAARPLE